VASFGQAGLRGDAGLLSRLPCFFSPERDSAAAAQADLAGQTFIAEPARVIPPISLL
jgi:hypothetical protein